MAQFWDKNRQALLTQEEADAETEKTLKDWAALIMAAAGWAMSYFAMGGFDTVPKRIVVVAAIVAGSWIGWKFSDKIWKVVGYTVLGGLALLAGAWLLRWIIGPG